MTQDEIIIAQQARIEQLKSSVQWALSNINCEPFEWTCEEDSDAHRHTIEALATVDDLSALRAHDAALTAKHIEICKKLAADNEGLAGEVWCERCADAIEKGGV